MRSTAPRPIKPGDVVAGFACERRTLDDWLAKVAVRAERDQTARTYVSVDQDTGGVVGYYCLSAFRIERASIGGGTLARNAPRAIPAVLLGRLAVDRTAQGRGLGVPLLHDAVVNAELVSARIGSRALVVEALDDSAARFCARYGFRPFPSDPLRLFHRL